MLKAIPSQPAKATKNNPDVQTNQLASGRRIKLALVASARLLADHTWEVFGKNDEGVQI